MSNSKKTIIFISNESKFLGAPKVLYRIIKYFHATQRYNIVVICPTDGPFKTALEQDKVPLLIPECLRDFYLHISQPHRFPLYKLLARCYDNAKLLFYFYKLFQSYSNAVVYANTSVVRYVAIPARLARKKLLWHVHEFSDNQLKQKLHSFLIRHFADRIIVHSSLLVSRLRISGRELEKVVFFRYPTILEPQDYRPKKSEPIRYDLIFAGKICLEKGALDLLEAIKNVVAIKTDLKVVMAGLFLEKDKEQILNFVANHDLEKNVSFPGFVPDLYQYISISKVVVLPTHRDYFPLLLLEAMMLERPVITTHVGDIRSVITHLENGIIIDAGNIQQLTDAILQILDDQIYHQLLIGVRKKKMELLSDQSDFKKIEQAINTPV